MHSKLRKILSLALTASLLFQQLGFAQITTELNIASHLSRMGSSVAVEKFRPLHLRYFSFDPGADNFKFLFDKGDFEKGVSSKGTVPEEKFKAESQELLKYFLIGIALPDSKFWVNLRPDTEDQIIEPELAQTDLGKALLEADLQLKKDTAKYTSPQTPEGREYWNRLYKKAEELYGYENVTIPTLTRPWIVPGEIIVRETQDSAFIYKSTLKVMLEEDYLASSKSPIASAADYSFKDARAKALNEYSTQLIRELIIPKLTKEVNISKRYAALRQVFYSLILSRWFKARYAGKPGFYASLIDSKNLNELISKESWSKTTYFEQYKKSFADGEYNIKESVYTPTGQVIRSYFSGGIVGPTIGQVFGTGAKAGIPENKNLVGTDEIPLKPAGSPVKEIDKIIDSLSGRLADLSLKGEIGIDSSSMYTGPGIDISNFPMLQELSDFCKIATENRKGEGNSILGDGWSFTIAKGTPFDKIREKLRKEARLAKSISDSPVKEEVNEPAPTWRKIVEAIKANEAIKDQFNRLEDLANFSKTILDELKEGSVLKDELTSLANTHLTFVNDEKNRQKTRDIGFAIQRERMFLLAIVQALQEEIILGVARSPVKSSKEIVDELALAKLSPENLKRMQVLLKDALYASRGRIITDDLAIKTGVSFLRRLQFLQNFLKSAKEELNFRHNELEQIAKASQAMIDNGTWVTSQKNMPAMRRKPTQEALEIQEAKRAISIQYRAIWETLEKLEKEVNAAALAGSPVEKIISLEGAPITGGEPICIDGRKINESRALVWNNKGWFLLKIFAGQPMLIFNFDKTTGQVSYEYRKPNNFYAPQITLSDPAMVDRLSIKYNLTDELIQIRVTQKIIDGLKGEGIPVEDKLDNGTSWQFVTSFSPTDIAGQNISGSPLEKTKKLIRGLIREDSTRSFREEDANFLALELNNIFTGSEDDVKIAFRILIGLYQTYLGRGETYARMQIIQYLKNYNEVRATVDKAKQQLASAAGSPVQGASSAMQAQDVVGGIDFRVMNIITQPLVASSSLNLKLPKVANLATIDLNEEFKQIQNMLNAGIIPSGERIKQFMAASALKGEWDKHSTDVISCLIEVCRLEEDNVSETPLGIKEALIIADSADIVG